MTYQIVKVFGDLYYKQMSIEEAVSKGFKIWTDPSDTLMN